MRPVPQDLFLEGIHAVVGACTPFVPDKSGQSLYVRPFLFGTEPGYAVRASGSARFMVIANPSEAYSAGAMKVLIEREQVRAAAGGLGTVKAGRTMRLRCSHRLVPSTRLHGRSMARSYDAAEH